MKTSIHFCKHL